MEHFKERRRSGIPLAHRAALFHVEHLEGGLLIFASEGLPLNDPNAPLLFHVEHRIPTHCGV